MCGFYKSESSRARAAPPNHITAAPPNAISSLISMSKLSPVNPATIAMPPIAIHFKAI